MGGRGAKYAILVRTAARQELAYRAVLAGRLVFFVVLLLIFSSLWRAIVASGPFQGQDPAQMLWYLFATECIVLSAPRLSADVEEDMRTGNLAYCLVRPVSYPAAMLCRGIGVFAVRVFYFALIGSGFTCIFSGALPQSVPGLACLAVLMPAAVFVLAVFETSIGLSALWLQEAAPLYWVWQKLLFIFGGLMFPLSIYPDWLREAASFTPFYALLYAPARLMIDFTWQHAAEALLLLLFWGGVGLALIRIVFRAAERSVLVNGG